MKSANFFNSDLNSSEIRLLVESHENWYHRYLFPGDNVTNSQQHTDLIINSLDELGLPSDASGLRVLDVGCCDGFFSFTMERRGAEVVSVDYRNVNALGFGIAKQIIGSDLTAHVDTIYNINEEKYGKFDIVLFLGVLYHLRHPILALDRMRSLLNPGGQIFIETHIVHDQIEDSDEQLNYPLSRFYPRDSFHNNYTNYFGPNRLGVDAWLDASEFMPTGFRLPIKGRGCFSATAISDPISAKYRDMEWGKSN